MKNLSKIEKEEYQRFYKDTPDKDFSPARNKAVIEQTIKDYEAMRASRMKDKVAHYEERADAVVHYLRHLANGIGESNMMKYFGKKELARLRGDQIRDQLMSKMNIIRARKGL